jgi:hypothetical protein
MIKIKTHGFFYALNFGWVEEHITFCLNVMLTLSLIPLAFLLYLSKALYIKCNHRLHELLLGELIQGSTLWLVTKKLVIPCFA